MAQSITWRGFTFQPVREVTGYSESVSDPFRLTVLDVGGGIWSATIQAGDLDGAGDGVSATDALDAALIALRASLARHDELITEAFRG